MTRPCCGTSVGVLLVDDHDRTLLIQRALPPVGIAPPAGHALDEHAGYVLAAVDEVAEEVGLTVLPQDLELLYDHWVSNRCRRRPANPPGHHWRVYRTRQWAGRLTPSPTETAGAAWYPPEHLQQLADRTVAWTRGQLTDAAYTAEPGLEPVWVVILADLGMVTLPPRALPRVLIAAYRPPTAVAQ